MQASEEETGAAALLVEDWAATIEAAPRTRRAEKRILNDIK